MKPFKKQEAVRRRVSIRYARPHALYLRGPVTGAPYVFNPGAGTAVDAGDAAALLETGLFERL
ncbi:MAG: hypothetical protein ACT4P6_00710 [Gemmatimonadaceae bacterium]